MDQKSNSKIENLKKVILTLEWDIPHIKNDSLRVQREFTLEQYKKEFEELMQQVKVEAS